MFSQPGLADLIRAAEVGLERGGAGRLSMPSMLDTSALVGEDKSGQYGSTDCI